MDTIGRILGRILAIIFVLGIIILIEISIIVRKVNEILQFVIIINGMSDMADDVMHSLTFKLNKVIALHNAQTNQAIATEQKRTRIFANRNSVGDSVGLVLQCPKMQGDLWWIMPWQHFIK